MMTARGRMLLVTLVVLLAAAVFWDGLRGGQPLPRVERTIDQNVLLVTIDTLRADTMAIDGGPAAAPNLARLAAEGVRYSFAHAHAVVTLPSHASLLTGTYPFQHGVRDNHSGFHLTDEATTIAERLKAAGFATGAFVSAFPLDSAFGLDAGFDRYDDETAAAAAPVTLVAPEREGVRTVAAARAWMAGQRSRWFLWVHLFEPHAPYRPPAHLRTYGGTPRGLYAGEVAAADEILGPLLNDVRSQERPTLAVVTSDHGEGLGDHGELTHGLFAYEATLRVPLIVSQIARASGDGISPGPATSHPSGAVNADPARHIDLVPTILDALGLPPAEELPGASLLRRGDRRETAYFESMGTMLRRGWAPLSGVLRGRMKLVDLPVPELYDLAADPGETANLYAGRPGDRDRLHALLRGFGARAPDPVGAEDPEVAARLRSLGYIGGAAPRKGRYTEEDDPKRLVQLDRDMHEAGWLRETGERERAIGLYRAILEQRPSMEPAWRFLSFVQWESGDRAAAIATLEEAVRRGVATAETVSQLEEYRAAR